MFDRIISIDWSGADTESKRVDLRIALWERTSRSCCIQLPPATGKTRSWQRSECRDFLQQMLSKRERTLVAMDFGFSLPWGSDQAIFNVKGWRPMISRIGQMYAQAGTARAVGQAINALPHLNGHGPYRFDENRADYRFYLDQGIAYCRATELAAPQSLSQWYMGSGNSVGFHTITGLSAMDHLIGLRDKGQLRFAVWPFEAIKPDQHVLVESYPAICPKCADDSSCRDGHEKDAWKVLQYLVSANINGQIGGWFDLPRLRFGRIKEVGWEQQVKFEGFIFGLK